MSAIPPSVIGSVLQSEPAQRQHARAADAARNAEADAARQSKNAPDAFVEIEATDADTQVHPDSGGTGGQGRHDARPEEDASVPPAPEGITTDEQGRTHLDLSA
jgi:hypothetical protein